MGWCHHHHHHFVPLLVPDVSEALQTQFYGTISNEMQCRWYWKTCEWLVTFLGWNIFLPIVPHSQDSYIWEPCPIVSPSLLQTGIWHLPQTLPFRMASFLWVGTVCSYYGVADIACTWSCLQWWHRNGALNIVWVHVQLSWETAHTIILWTHILSGDISCHVCHFHLPIFTSYSLSLNTVFICHVLVTFFFKLRGLFFWSRISTTWLLLIQVILIFLWFHSCMTGVL